MLLYDELNIKSLRVYIPSKKRKLRSPLVGMLSCIDRGI